MLPPPTSLGRNKCGDVSLLGLFWFFLYLVAYTNMEKERKQIIRIVTKTKYLFFFVLILYFEKLLNFRIG